MNILITGAAGFIASRLDQDLSTDQRNKLILVDDLSTDSKRSNWESIPNAQTIDREVFLQKIKENTYTEALDWVIHLGARTDTTEMDYEVHRHLNLEYSQSVWTYCTAHQIDLVYASSAATYGGGEHGYRDDLELASVLEPLNPYGVSKNEFDKWVLSQSETPPHWYGLKFFNVYGPHEQHKGRMASVVFHAYRQIDDGGRMVLFRSHNPEYADGEQLRDFVYVDDVVDVIEWLMDTRPQSDIYNLGTGQARTFLDLARGVFDSMQLPEDIQWVDTPEDIRDKYQYFTEADMSKLRERGYDRPFRSLEQGIAEYMPYLQALD